MAKTATARAKRPETDGVENTGAQTQVIVTAMPGQAGDLSRTEATTYATYREIRRQPTVALARAFAMAPILTAGWSYESDDDVPSDWVRFIQDQLDPIRQPLLQTCFENGIDFGWAPFEKVFEVQDVDADKRIVLKRLKALLVDLTTIQVYEDGKFAGFKQQNRATGEEIELDVADCLLVNFRVEGDDHYGQPLLKNVEKAYRNWKDGNAGAERYDKKIAGSHWVVHYPIGQSPDSTGTLVDNYTVAQQILETLEASGAVAIPRKVAAHLDELRAEVGDAWGVELLTAGSQQAAFIDRLNYNDKQFVRGLLLPERAVLEGQFGTKAEASVHADFALTIRALEHEHVARLINWHVVDQLLALNYGEFARGKVRIEPAPLVDEKLTFMRDLYKLLLAHPTASFDAIEGLDIDALMDAIEIPKSKEIIGSDGPLGEEDMKRQLASLIQSLYERATASDQAA